MGCATASAVALSTSSPSWRPMVTIRRPLWPLTDEGVVWLRVRGESGPAVMISGQEGELEAV